MRLHMYMLFCVGCVLNWISLAYQPIAKIFTKKIERKGKGVLSTYNLYGLFTNNQNGLSSNVHMVEDCKESEKNSIPINENRKLFSKDDHDNGNDTRKKISGNYAGVIQMPFQNSKDISCLVAGFMEFDPKTAASTYRRVPKKGRSISSAPWFNS